MGAEPPQRIPIPRCALGASAPLPYEETTQTHADPSLQGVNAAAATKRERDKTAKDSARVPNHDGSRSAPLKGGIPAHHPATPNGMNWGRASETKLP